jgi:hypothetical protein
LSCALHTAALLGYLCIAKHFTLDQWNVPEVLFFLVATTNLPLARQIVQVMPRKVNPTLEIAPSCAGVLRFRERSLRLEAELNQVEQELKEVEEEEKAFLEEESDCWQRFNALWLDLRVCWLPHPRHMMHGHN